jgi:hypothetical protein
MRRIRRQLGASCCRKTMKAIDCFISQYLFEVLFFSLSFNGSNLRLYREDSNLNDANCIIFHRNHSCNLFCVALTQNKIVF